MKKIKTLLDTIKEKVKNVFSNDNISKSKANEFYSQYLAKNLDLSEPEISNFINLYHKKIKFEKGLYFFCAISFLFNSVIPIISFMYTKNISVFDFFIPSLLISILVFMVSMMILGTLYNQKSNSMFKKAINNKSPGYLMLKQKEIIKSMESEKIDNEVKHFIVNDIYQNLNTPDKDFFKDIYFSDMGSVLAKKKKSEMNYKLIDKNHLDIDKKIAFIQNLDIKNKV